MLATMIDQCAERCRIASSTKNHAEALKILEDMKTDLRKSPPSADEVSSLLRDVLMNPRMPGASFVFVAAWYNLSQEYVPVLCEILLSRPCAGWHEQTIEILGELANPNAVPALAKSIEYRWEFDEWYSIPRKALQSLNSIGTAAAVAVVEAATMSNIAEIRQEATDILEEA